MSAPARRVRRYEPDRKQRLIEVTLDVIAEHGVSGTTHRLVAEAADVSPGSITYHFDSLNDLLAQAFAVHAARMSELYARHFDAVTDRDGLVDAVTDLVLGNNAGSHRDSIITFELYLAALRTPELRAITESWMGASRSVLHRFVDPVSTRGVDALIEGLIVHMILSTRRVSRADTRRYVDRQVPAELRSTNLIAKTRKHVS